MSRSNATKSRADKSASKASAAAATPVTHDIIPGKFTDHDWTSLVDRDDAGDFIAELLEEWYVGVDKIIYENYIQRQLVPYTILQAKDAILQIMEWQFLSRDNGEPVDDATGGWIPDTEPEAAVMDCWAQGSVPKAVSSRRTSYMPHSLTPLDDLADAASESSTSDQPSGERQNQVDVAGDAGVSAADSSSSLYQSTVLGNEDGDVISEQVPATVNVAEDADGLDVDKEDKNYASEPVASSFKSPPVTTTENNRLIQKQRPAAKTTQANGGELSTISPPEKSEAVSRPVKSVPAGDYVIKRISPHRLPTNMVNTVFAIVDPSVQEADERRKAARQGRRPLQGTSKKASKSDIDADILAGEQFVEIASTFHPMLIETMDVAAGVVIRDNKRVKKGPKQHTVAEAELLSTALRRGLQPVRLQHQTQPLSASDLLGSHVPIIRPLVETTPIPPINQQMTST